MRRFSSLIRRAATIAVGTILACGAVLIPPQAHADADVYITEGEFEINGRLWRTACEPYSQTERCRTEIKATTVSAETRDGQPVFVKKTDWAFNNLTYLPSPRSLWTSNPLGAPGRWPAADGRLWRTECDTPQTGGNGCRSYAEARVVAEVRPGVFGWQTQWVFNNIVLFSAAAEVEPADEVTFADGAFTECVREVTGRDQITRAEVEALTELECMGIPRVRSFEGISALRNLEILNAQNQGELGLEPISLTPLADLPKLRNLYLYNSAITDLDALADLSSVERLMIGGTRYDVQGFDPVLIESMDLTALLLSNLGLADVGFLAAHPSLEQLNLDRNEITDVTPIASLEYLVRVSLIGNPITDWSPLDARVAEGLLVVHEAP